MGPLLAVAAPCESYVQYLVIESSDSLWSPYHAMVNVQFIEMT